MKLRIKGDSLRLRVSRSELDSIIRGERIEDTILFSPDPDAALTYCLDHAAGDAPTGLRYSPGKVTVLLAARDVKVWSDPGQVGIYTAIAVGPTRSLELIIEEDFACLDRDDQGNADTFENPHAGAKC